MFWPSPLVDDRQRETLKNSGGEVFPQDLKYVGAAASASSRRNFVFDKTRLVEQLSRAGICQKEL
jgi:hypothetical protein